MNEAYGTTQNIMHLNVGQIDKKEFYPFYVFEGLKRILRTWY